MLCTKAISLHIKELAGIYFPAFGSLYFSNSPVDQLKKVILDFGRFGIRPSCSPSFYWNCSPGELELYGGPSPDCGSCELLRLPFGN
jgi:hypothetical protein